MILGFKVLSLIQVKSTFKFNREKSLLPEYHYIWVSGAYMCKLSTQALFFAYRLLEGDFLLLKIICPSTTPKGRKKERKKKEKNSTYQNVVPI